MIHKIWKTALFVNLIFASTVCQETKIMAESVLQSDEKTEPSEQIIEQIINTIVASPHPVNSDTIQDVKEYIIKYFTDLGYDNIECQKFEYNDENNENAIRRSSQVDIFLAPTAEGASVDGVGENIIITKESSADIEKI